MQKYSNYAFRTPSECFAEMYACYFLTNGKKLPKDHRDWFEANIPDAKETFERQKLKDKHKFQVSKGHYYKRNLI